MPCAAEPPPAPRAASGLPAPRQRQRRRAEAPVALRIGVDDRAGPPLPLGAQLARIGEREAAPPQVERIARAPPPSAGRSRAGSAPPAPPPPTAAPRAASSAAQTSRDGCANRAQTETVPRLRPVQPREIRLAQHRIFGGQPVMLERKDVGRDQPVGEREPAPPDRPRDSRRRSGRNRASARRARARAGTSRRTAPPAPRPDSRAAIAAAIARDARVDRLGQLGGDKFLECKGHQSTFRHKLASLCRQPLPERRENPWRPRNGSAIFYLPPFYGFRRSPMLPWTPPSEPPGVAWPDTVPSGGPFRLTGGSSGETGHLRSLADVS